MQAFKFTYGGTEIELKGDAYDFVLSICEASDIRGYHTFVRVCSDTLDRLWRKSGTSTDHLAVRKSSGRRTSNINECRFKNEYHHTYHNADYFRWLCEKYGPESKTMAEKALEQLIGNFGIVQGSKPNDFDLPSRIVDQYSRKSTKWLDIGHGRNAHRYCINDEHFHWSAVENEWCITYVLEDGSGLRLSATKNSLCWSLDPNRKGKC